MEGLVLIAMEPLKGSALCRVPGCKERASVQINRYFDPDDSCSWDAHSSGPFCQKHFEKVQKAWSDAEVATIHQP